MSNMQLDIWSLALRREFWRYKLKSPLCLKWDLIHGIEFDLEKSLRSELWGLTFRIPIEKDEAARED